MHDPANPPRAWHDFRATISLSGQKRLKMADAGGDDHTMLALEIRDAGSAGLLRPSDYACLEQFADDLVLSCNLTMKKAAFSRQRLGPMPARAGGRGSRAYNVHVNTMIRDIIDKDSVMGIFGMVTRLRRMRAAKGVRKSDIVKALDRYGAAMRSTGKDVLAAIYLSSALSSNSDGDDPSGEGLDTKMASISGMSAYRIGPARGFANEYKHVSGGKGKGGKRLRAYERNTSGADGRVRHARKVAQRIILHRLEEATGGGAPRGRRTARRTR